MAKTKVVKANGHDPILDLSTEIAPRKTIKVDGKVYQLKNLDEFPFAAHARIMDTGRRAMKLQSPEELTEENADQAAAALEKALHDIVVDDDGMIAKLNDSQRIAVFGSFFSIVAENQKRSGLSATSKSTSSKPSPDSSVSTVAT